MNEDLIQPLTYQEGALLEERRQERAIKRYCERYAKRAEERNPGIGLSVEDLDLAIVDENISCGRYQNVMFTRILPLLKGRDGEVYGVFPDGRAFKCHREGNNLRMEIRSRLGEPLIESGEFEVVRNAFGREEEEIVKSGSEIGGEGKEGLCFRWRKGGVKIEVGIMHSGIGLDAELDKLKEDWTGELEKRKQMVFEGSY